MLRLSETQAIYSITPFTLLDFPGKTACILWFAGCNMRCPYCYNPNIVLGKGSIDYADALAFIRSRQGLLDGVVFSGGEASQHKGIIPFASIVRAEGFQVKLDTNGSHPERIHQMIEEGCVDYVALDFKAPPEKFKTVTQSDLFDKFDASLQLLLYRNVPFEVRTTVHTSLLSVNDIRRMADYLVKSGYTGTYYLQNFVGTTDTLGAMAAPSDKIQKDTITAALQIEVR